jgi:hypothetical protein
VNTENRNLPAIPTVSSLRQIARTEKDRKALIESFITEDLHLACRRVDAWLKYDKEMNPSGLLPVHVTSVALNSREIYLLLLHFAARSCRIELPSDWQKTMQALATVLHWFAVDKTKAVNRIYAECREEVSLARIRTALHDAVEAGELSEIHSPEAVESFVSIPTENFKDWNWWRPIHGNGVAEEIQVRRQSWERFLNFRSNRDLLLYAQRHFLAQRFRDYDPARRDLWEAHNRPWDFDHILASYYFYNRKDGSPFREVCGQWGCTIGNLRAWPFEDNRSDQADTAADKLKGNQEQLAHSFLTSEEEAAFSAGDKTRWEEVASRDFIKACRQRLFRIYRVWYDTLAVGELLTTDAPPPFPNEPVSLPSES